MPNVESPPQFDAEGLVTAVHQQDIGLRVTVNNVESARQLLYKAARQLALPIHIYSYPRRPNALALMKKEAQHGS